jgi:hypothetical protein
LQGTGGSGRVNETTGLAATGIPVSRPRIDAMEFPQDGPGTYILTNRIRSTESGSRRKAQELPRLLPYCVGGTDIFVGHETQVFL